MTFVPDMSRAIRVTSRIPPEEEDDPNSSMRLLLEDWGYVARAALVWDGQITRGLVQKIRSKQTKLDDHTCIFRLGPTEASKKSYFVRYPKSPGHELEQDKLTDLLKGSTMSFGLKLEQKIWNPNKNDYAYYGFRFLQLELATCKSGNEGRELIIAVKLPAYGDVPAHMILKQHIEGVNDLSIIHGQGSRVDLATFHNHCLGITYKPRSFNRGWEPSVELFFKNATFDAGKLEQFILTKEKRFHMYYLSKVSEWFEDMITDGDLNEDWEAAFLDGNNYVQNRANTMCREASYREEFERYHDFQSSAEGSSEESTVRRLKVARRELI